VSGMMMPPFVLSSPSMRRMTTRSCNGRNFMGLVSGRRASTMRGEIASVTLLFGST
jgi:hypothetical protein